jgi:hypothetical protein
MPIDLEAYRASALEQSRIRDLFRLIPERGNRALDVGSRDGYMSKLLADRFGSVVALDLERPDIKHLGVECVQGNASHLEFADDSFDLVLCAEVLEHVPSSVLRQVCAEITRVAKDVVVIGVPFRQDLRLGSTYCASCGCLNPPWGHVNSFDKSDLIALFPTLELTEVSFVGASREVTNAVSAALMNFAGNPFGSYDQDEACISCGQRLTPPKSSRTLVQRLATRAAVIMNRIQQRWTQPRGNWIHLRFTKVGR